MRRLTTLLLSSALAVSALLFAPQASWAYPFWAQQNYDSPGKPPASWSGQLPPGQENHPG
jgi:Spy/CpxP family protein refolding chaperone